MMNNLTAQQITQLLQPINPRRVLQDGKGHSHVSQQDVTAHLNRVFGFGNFSTQLLDLTLIGEECRNPEVSYRERRWDVIYRATMRININNPDGTHLTSYEDASTGDAQNQVRHDAHDLAMKSAISVAKKRCCINLGDQFGLSLYNKGQLTALVMGTLVHPETEYEEGADVQEGVAKQVSMGTDEAPIGEPVPDEQQERILEESLGAKREVTS
jgi:recombination DNA repair RAD52 pathway protein